MADELTDGALRYHRIPRPGKIEVVPTKPLATQRDLSLAYSPGVAAACNEIVRDPATAAELTARANLVAVVTNGTAVLGLGAIGPLAAKPVMEGKGVLFKKFAGIDVFDLELAELDQERLVDIVAALEPTFGGINLEDIKAPECFYVEQKLRERMAIPVFHDDQHGTAIIVGAALLNALSLVGKDITKVKLVVSGAGAAALSCLGVLEKLGLPRENMWVTDIAGVVWKGRNELMDPWKERYARETGARTLGEVIGDADVFLGLSAAGVLKKDMVARMAAKPLIFALANPNPEITPEDVAAVRDDAIMATGRSDYPNQVNNVLCFPYIFRGALDAGATTVNDEMKIACVRALAALARKEPSEVVARAFGEQAGGFGPNQIIPKPFDPRLIVELAPAVAKAAMDSGVATRPIADFEAYRDQLSQFVFKSGLIMRPVFEQARSAPKRVIFSAGEDDRVLRAVQIILDEGIAQPILIGRPEVVRRRAERLGLRFLPGVDVELINPSQDSRYDKYWGAYHELMERRGVTEPTARNLVRSSPTLIAALAVRLGDADAMIAGAYGRFRTHFNHVRDVIGLKEGVKNMAALSLLVMPTRSLFIADTYVNYDPDPETLAEITLLAADEVLRFGIQPKVALISHSSFGSSDHPSARKMAAAVKILHARAPSLEVDGEMHGDAALDVDVRNNVFPRSKLKEAANLVICPSLDSANIAFNLLKNGADGLHIGPMLLGTDLPAHVLTPSVTARGILNMTALSVVEAQRLAEARG
ncbi:MAG: NADP-dependent malic enzyme [Reyranella sp.]|uniref:NADP-dependent malic enzyme n=1 Tax=Reyranella sp. TaxID=1929291 RepID=UPI0009651CC3|nr:NADP-dependent malic enzyme [Reyranella sp.]MBN9537057.1 NADP-dependent malic enzyme [Alphaproteobacteria bacterium]MBR2814716.1 NADP-dependent malic enzyme [Reyranella sp.]OJU32137.1 MAG: NADP-dependent malic enzyme [Alphaproteobacteria bacterium 65-37]